MGMLYDAQMRHVHTAGKRWDGSGYTCTDCRWDPMAEWLDRQARLCMCGHPGTFHEFSIEDYTRVYHRCTLCAPREIPLYGTVEYLERVQQGMHEFEPVSEAS